MYGMVRLLHQAIPSRAARTTANPLFPVDYPDCESREDLHEPVHETVCFGRNNDAILGTITQQFRKHS